MTRITPTDPIVHLPTDWDTWNEDDGQLGRAPAPEPDGWLPARLRSELCI